MAESNLRTMLAAARGREVHADVPVGDSEMAAILGVLKGEPSANDHTDPDQTDPDQANRDEAGPGE